jgi:hypothetical protein
MMNGQGKSDGPVVPAKPSNKAGEPAAEGVEGRGPAKGKRYADDFIVGFRYRHEAERFLAVLPQRFAKFGLELHPDKMRLIEFGPFAADNRRKRGLGKPETFHFLGFTHIR